MSPARTHVVLIFFACLLTLACGTESPPDAPPTNEAVAPVEGFLDVHGVRLHYLDWGGTGDGLLFLHGLGDSPHAYDEIAPEFGDQFRVIAYARRAHGRSSGSEGPFDIPTLVEDLRGVLDSLGIQRTALVGWSLGGLEATEFAARYPERVTGVIILDAYNWTDPSVATWLQHFPLSAFPTPEELGSMDRFLAWWKTFSAPTVPWTEGMQATAQDLVAVQPDGSVQLHITEAVEVGFFSQLLAFHPPFDAVRSPLLGIFADEHPDVFLPPEAPDSLVAEVETWWGDFYQPWREGALRQFRQGAPAARVVMLDHTRHTALPWQRRDTILAEMRRFLAGTGEG